MQINRTVYYYSLNQWSLQTKFREDSYISKILGNIDSLMIWGKDDKPSITDHSGSQAFCNCVVTSALGLIRRFIELQVEPPKQANGAYLI